MSDGARLNLVRSDTLESSEGLSVTNSTALDRYDEVELVAPDGEPAAMLAPPQWISQDVVYQYITGGMGRSPRRARHQITLAVDYLDDATRGKLERWQRDRALVWFNPGFGRFSEVAYRALPGAGTDFQDGSTTFTDLTGRYNLSTQGDNAENYVWDHELQLMRGLWTTANSRRVVPTPAGAAQVFERAKTNIHYPAYPHTSAAGHGATDTGWQKSGANSADITFGSVSSGAFAFGHDDCEDSLKVETTHAASRTRSLYADGQWDSGDGEYISNPMASGAGTVAMSVWLKGRFSDAANLSLYQENGDSDSIALDAYDFSEWRKVSLHVYSADWSTGLCRIRMNLSTAGTADSDSFYIGPMIVTFAENASHPEWSESTLDGTDYDTTTTADHVSAASFTFPQAGSAIAAFYIPETVQPFEMAPTSAFYPINHSETAGRLGIYADSSGDIGAYWLRTSGASLSGAVTPIAGQVNTICAVWDSAWDYRLYFNGEIVDTATTSERQTEIADSSGTLYFASSSSGPAWFLSARIDHRTWTAAQVEQMHYSLADPVAALVSAQARGRKYAIQALPSTPRNAPGGTQWTGNLVLEEYEYDANLADLTTEETY